VSHYEVRLEQDLESIRLEVEKIGAWVQENVRDGVWALTRFDRVRANETILRDRAVNRRIEDLDHLAHLFVIKHLPSAGHLRFVSAVLRISVALERIGDYAATMCRETLQLSGPPPDSVIEDVEVLGQQVGNALHSAVAAFVGGDLVKAGEAGGMAKQVRTTYRKTIRDLVAAGEAGTVSARDLFSLMTATRVLKRVGDQAENLCEQTAFVLTGETKDEKTYRILFIDEDNRLLSIMAEAFAREAYPDNGRFLSAGAHPAGAFDPGFVEFLADRGVDLEGPPLSVEEAVAKAGRHYHVVIGMDVNPAKALDDVPFRTVVLEWDLSSILKAAEGQEGRERYQALYRAVASEVTGLMETLGLETDR